MPTQFGSLHGESEELHRVGRDHPALLLVDLQAQLLRQVAGNASHDPFPGPWALDQNDQVIGVAGKLMAALLQFLVQIIQQDIRQQWG